MQGRKGLMGYRRPFFRIETPGAGGRLPGRDSLQGGKQAERVEVELSLWARAEFMLLPTYAACFGRLNFCNSEDRLEQRKTS